jgi:CubicO group peptidase (beta-lactamase class C family)
MTFSYRGPNPSQPGHAAEHTRRCSIAAIALASLLGACDDSPASDSMGNGGSVEERFQPLARAMEQERIAAGVPGAALAIVERGEVTFARGFGTKSPDGGGEVEPSTLFAIGSCSKMLTSIAVLQTVADGRVTLEHPVTDYVPDFHFNREGTSVEGIAVRHLLTHTSGIVDAEVEPDYPDGRADEALGQYIAGPFADIAYGMVPPGTFFNYANPNYILLGRLAELVNQQPYRSMMAEKVFLPLGMERTFAASEDVIADGDYALAKGCSASKADCTSDPILLPEHFDKAWRRPAGAIWSSVLDLSKVARFLTRGNETVLPSEQWQAMTSVQVNTLELGDVLNYGYGVQVGRGIFLGSYDHFFALETVSHGGLLSPGYATEIFCIKSQDFCMITLANADNGQFNRSLYTAITTLVKLPATSPAPDLATHPERYPDYAGTYVDSFDIGEVRITTKAGKLYAAIPKFDAEGTPYNSEITPLAGDNFAFTGGREQVPVTFIADESGQYKYIRSRSYVPIRTDATAGN